MRKGRDGEQTTEKSDGNSGPLTSLPVGLPKVDRLQRRRSCQNLKLSSQAVIAAAAAVVMRI